MAGYLPAKKLLADGVAELAAVLRARTALPEEYIAVIEQTSMLPGRVETNEEGWSGRPWFDAWLRALPEKKRADPFQGAVERRRVPLDPVSVRESLHPHPMLPSDAETLAGAMALLNAGVDWDEVDLVLVASQVPDLALPSNASLVQHKLGLSNAGAYALDTCCSSGVTMLETACALVRAGMKRNVLIVASYIDSHVTDRSDYFSINTGDAAVAMLISRVEDGFGYIASHSHSQGSRHQGIIFERRTPQLSRPRPSGLDQAQLFTTFKDPKITKEIAAHATQDLTRVVARTLGKAGLTTTDIDFLVTHQPVAWAPNAWRTALDIPADRFLDTFTEYGNIANCCAPVNLLEGVQRGLVGSSDRVMVTSSGAGENVIAVFLTAPPQLIGNCRLG
ncbi:3-oxoacyl-[acyl-carrier-protein] synthase III C-terminal domain-containing protein [Streptomyces sp. YIM 121038]|uniref:3-oxoacyl-ACP synthase III family protein n=1 Tax=Streptomyces sp. YIM 121038 TaxID=2136401 RepID=UPI00111074CE|nr:3-oxoacyl-[acyl-carrier-protein] synthase III C-terminal domain-containing protein [Streptomyces sp. YIM 121038]